ncbi:MAG TPA: inorganic phosphate transporter, partial [Tenuifilaceae bacterium]|nr:inorganic phosphate transporter [Tenuifilaceae bacterium]
LAIISGILISVVVAFLAGSIIQYITRIIFTFQYEKNFKYFGSIWGGIALTAITYFILMKGVEGSPIIEPEVMAYIKGHTTTILMYMFVLWTVIFQICISILKWNTLRFVVLVGTFALALSFAGNDLVNFIGVFMAGLKSYQIHIANPGIPADQLLMTDLTKPVATNIFYLMIAGLIMVITLWLSRKARTVTETEINLSRQDTGTERFGSTQLSRSIVRVFRNLSRDTEKILPKSVNRFLESRFTPVKSTGKRMSDAPSFDLIRASVNLTVASILISSATSLKLPLSTTYVTFMVAMGSSLADKAWGRESAVYRITGVLTVIAGWFFTAFIAFTVAFLIAGILYYGGVFAVVVMILIAVALIIKSYMMHRKKEQQKASDRALEELAMEDSLINKCTKDVNKSLNDILRIYNQTVTGLTLEDRKLLKQLDKDVEDLNIEAKKLKYNVYTVLKELQADAIETGHYYVQVIDYLREIAHSLTFVTGPAFEHIDNNHKGFTKSQNQELIEISNMISKLFELIMVMVKDNDYTAVPDAIKMQQKVLEMLNDARKKQIKRIKQNEAGTRNSILYLAIINETKNIMLHTVNLLKAQRDFILNNVD